MISKTLKICLFAFLSIALLTAFASATVDFVGVSGANQNVVHSSSATISFNVQATSFTGQFDNASLVLPNIFGSQTAWTGDTGKFTLLPNTNVSRTVILTIPSFQASGTYSDVIGFSGTYNKTGTIVVNNLPITINITSSPSLSFVTIKDFTKTQNGTFKLNNTGNIDFSNIVLSVSGDFNATLSTYSISSLGKGQLSSEISISPSAGVNLAELSTGSNTITITASNSTASLATKSFTITNDFCDDGNINASQIDIKDISDESSEDEWEWKPLDKVTISADIKNKLDDDEDFVVELALYDKEEDVFIELNDEESLEADVSIDEDDTEEVSFEFTVPADIEESTGRYALFVKAYVDGQEDEYCNSQQLSQNIKISRESKEVKVTEISAPTSAYAGSTVTISSKIYNTGDNDEKKVKVTLKNTQLGLNLEYILNSLDSGDSEDVEFSFVIPSTAQDGTYTLKIEPEFDYSSSSDFFKKSGDEEDIQIKVTGGTPSSSTTAGITAALDSEAKAGEKLSVKVTLKNLGANKTIFAVGAKNFESWASLESISERIVTLNAGESKELTFAFNVNKGVSGEKSFRVETIAGDKLETKEVAVNIADESWLSGLSGQNSLIWIVGIINVILIVFIIIFAIRALSR